VAVAKILVVDDDEAMRRLLRISLVDAYEIVDTGKPEEALALALEHKPDVILLDLRMPGYSGFELCKTFTSYSVTQLIPVYVISGEGGAKTKDFCRELGATAYFEKPVDFDALRASLQETLRTRRQERRAELRVGLRVTISGRDASGAAFSLPTTALNVSKGAFLCACNAALAVDAICEVFLLGTEMEPVGKARVVRVDGSGEEYPQYAFRFVEKTETWVLQ
jgi:DNA-binding response OmpR family regulator